MHYSAEEFASEVDAAFAALRTSPVPVSILFDLTQLSKSDSRNRQIAAEYLKRESVMVRSKVLGAAFVTESSVLRGAITAIGWLGKFPIPTKTFDAFGPAESWLAQLSLVEGLDRRLGA